MSQPHLHDKIPRGTRLAGSGEMSQSTFEAPEVLAKVESLKHSSKKLLLGQIDADIQVEQDAETKRVTRRAVGGQLIGSDDDRHVMTVAGSRSGKGVAAIVPNLLSYSGSVLAIDPKGELASITARCRAEKLGQKVYVLDPFKRCKGFAKRECRASFNPLDILTPASRTLVEDAGLIADAIVQREGNDPHWDESAMNFLEGVILHVATHENYEGRRNLVTVYEVIMRIDSVGLEDEMMGNPRMEVIDIADSFFSKQDKERDSILSTLRRHIRFLGYQNMQSVLKTSDFKLEDLKRERVTVYLSLPAIRLGTCSRWLRLFVNLTLARMEEAEATTKTPVLLCLDEFAVLGHMKTIEDAAGQIAGFGCRLWPILQDLGQLEALYSDRWQTFMGNAGILQFFGNSDMKTLEWISSRLGETTVQQSSQSEVTYDEKAVSGRTGVNTSVQSHPLMTPEEISRFFGREDRLQRQLIIRTGFSPMIIQRVCYYADPRFEGRFENV